MSRQVLTPHPPSREEVEEAVEFSDLSKRNSERFKDHLALRKDAVDGGGSGTKGKKIGKSRSSFGNNKKGTVMGPLRGTSTTVEKSYLRLTADPDPSSVRPLHVLKRSLEHVKAHWVRHEDYEWCADQMKAIRQDLLVQGIKSSFTVEVYFHHMRIALECGDLNEYNQCQSSILQLEEDGVALDAEWKDELDCYHIIYTLYINNRYQLEKVLTEKFRGGAEDHAPMTAYALCVWRALVLGYYEEFFSLYGCAPKMSGYLMDYHVRSVREHGIRCAVAAYDRVPLTYLTALLGFSSGEEATGYVRGRGCVVADDGHHVDCRQTRKLQSLK